MMLNQAADLAVLSGLALGLSAAPSQWLAQPLTIQQALRVGLLLLLWHAALAAQGLYAAAPRRLSHECKMIFIALALAGAALFALMGWRDGGRLAVFVLAGACGLCVLRLAWGAAARRLRSDDASLSLVIVGGGRRAQRFAEQIIAQPELGYRLVGYIESDPAFSFYELAETPWLGTLDDLPQLLAQRVIDEAVIALPIKSHYGDIEKALAGCAEQGITAHMLCDYFPLPSARYESLAFAGAPLVSVQSAPPWNVSTECKRLFDFIAAAVLLVTLAPLFALIALAIRLEGRGPVFFVQERMGYNKRRFRLFKFRTMVADAEARMKDIEHLNEKEGPIFKIKDDPRITRTGRWLRKTSLDELPQLLNVLRGEMSLVGPRPLSMRDALGMSETWQKRRFSVRPGITGLWQVSGRSNLSFERWMRLDLEYIDRWSLALDLRILLRTIPAVLTGHGAA
jgi:exopolysaccharide biosynthesis polyprenyl glycosylphosphotransferase